MITLRAQARENLLIGLGLLVDPIRRLITADSDPKRRLPYVRSQFQSDVDKFHNQLSVFCNVGSLRFDTEYNKARRAVNCFGAFFEQIEQDFSREHITKAFDECLQHCASAIRSIPADDPDLIIPAGSPFSAYLHLRALCAGAANRLQLFDPFLDADAFHRYLSDVPSSATLTIVTSTSIMNPSEARNLQRRDRIIAVSVLLAEQRPEFYRLLVANALHDRHLRVDNRVYHLGGSIKDAARSSAYAVTQMEGSSGVHDQLDAIVEKADVWYPSSGRQHRRE